MSKELIKRILSSILLIPLCFFLINKGNLLFNFFIITCLIISIYEWQMMSKKKIYNIFGIIFIFFSFYCFYKLRNDFIGEFIYTYFVLLICISNDIGGYAFGKIFKGPKLTKISPKKTYAGYILAVFLTYIFSAYFKSNYNIENSLKITLLVLLISSASQLGDIIISYFKRLAKIKDTGKIVPGHGGILDRIDGMLFAVPFSYILFSLNLFNLIQ